jgi:hypothetical protein
MYREAAKRDPDPIQSLRIASTLADRYRAVVSATYVDTSALELAIGEAQQIYPEIWRHLDEGREALAAKDRDVRVFDGLRSEALRTLGVTHVDSHTTIDPFSLMLGRLNVVDMKTATFNLRGHQLAVAACQALMEQMPEIDWAALAHAEDKEIRAAGSMQSAKWIGALKWGGVVVGLALVGVAIHRFAMGPEELRSEPRERLADGELSASARLQASLQEEIVTLKRSYLATCDRQVRDRLVAALRADHRESAAAKLEREKCVPERPACGEIASLIARRQAAAFEIEHARPTCYGAVIAATGSPRTGFVIAASGKVDGDRVVVRGVISPSGEHILVPFASSPENAELIGVTDLDGDDVDELVMASDRGFVISKLERGAFRDILGPPVTCLGQLSVQKDFRNGRTGEQRRPVLTIPELEEPMTGCPEPGQYYFKLAGDKLVED